MVNAFPHGSPNPVNTFTGRLKSISEVSLLKRSKSIPSPLFKTKLIPKLVLVVFSQLRFSLPRED